MSASGPKRPARKQVLAALAAGEAQGCHPACTSYQLPCDVFHAIGKPRRCAPLPRRRRSAAAACCCQPCRSPTPAGAPPGGYAGHGSRGGARPRHRQHLDGACAQGAPAGRRRRPGRAEARRLLAAGAALLPCTRLLPRSLHLLVPLLARLLGPRSTASRARRASARPRPTAACQRRTRGGRAARPAAPPTAASTLRAASGAPAGVAWAMGCDLWELGARCRPLLHSARGVWCGWLQKPQGCARRALLCSSPPRRWPWRRSASTPPAHCRPDHCACLPPPSQPPRPRLQLPAPRAHGGRRGAPQNGLQVSYRVGCGVWAGMRGTRACSEVGSSGKCVGGKQAEQQSGGPGSQAAAQRRPGARRTCSHPCPLACTAHGRRSHDIFGRERAPGHKDGRKRGARLSSRPCHCCRRRRRHTQPGTWLLRLCEACRQPAPAPPLTGFACRSELVPAPFDLHLFLQAWGRTSAASAARLLAGWQPLVSAQLCRTLPLPCAQAWGRTSGSAARFTCTMAARARCPRSRCAALVRSACLPGCSLNARKRWPRLVLACWVQVAAQRVARRSAAHRQQCRARVPAPASAHAAVSCARAPARLPPRPRSCAASLGRTFGSGGRWRASTACPPRRSPSCGQCPAAPRHMRCRLHGRPAARRRCRPAASTHASTLGPRSSPRLPQVPAAEQRPAPPSLTRLSLPPLPQVSVAEQRRGLVLAVGRVT